MNAVKVEQVWQLLEQLDTAEQQTLITRWLRRHPQPFSSLRNAYADPPLTIDDDTLRADLKSFSQAWEDELDNDSDTN